MNEPKGKNTLEEMLEIFKEADGKLTNVQKHYFYNTLRYVFKGTEKQKQEYIKKFNEIVYGTKWGEDCIGL